MRSTSQDADHRTELPSPRRPCSRGHASCKSRCHRMELSHATVAPVRRPSTGQHPWSPPSPQSARRVTSQMRLAETPETGCAPRMSRVPPLRWEVVQWVPAGWIPEGELRDRTWHMPLRASEGGESVTTYRVTAAGAQGGPATRWSRGSGDHRTYRVLSVGGCRRASATLWGCAQQVASGVRLKDECGRSAGPRGHR